MKRFFRILKNGCKFMDKYRDPNAGTTVVIDDDTFAKSFNELGGRIVYYTVQR